MLNASSSKLVLIMLSENACSPCYRFTSEGQSGTVLSPEKLRDVLLWAAQTDPSPPELFFLAAADTSIEPSIASVLEDMDEKMLMPGQSTCLNIEFLVPMGKGMVTKKVILYTNETKTPEHIFYIKADIVPQAIIQPTPIDFGTVERLCCRKQYMHD